MADSKPRKNSRKSVPAPPSAGHDGSTVERVSDLQWAGHHARAIELATTALAAANPSPGERLDLFDLRAESFIALGELDHAAEDAAAMVDLAANSRGAATTARALNREALVLTRQRDWKGAIKSAGKALVIARKAKNALLEGASLARLAEAQFRQRVDFKAAEQNATRAVEIFRSMGEASSEGRALWVLSVALSNQGRVAESQQAARRAAELCRQAGDLYGAGNALNMLIFNEADLAVQLKVLNQALQDFEVAGYLERQGVATSNFGVAYSQLGLYRRARRLFSKAGDMYRRSGATASLGSTLGELAETELAAGHLERARGYAAEMAAMADEARDPLVKANLPLVLGRVMLREGDAAAARKEFERAEQRGRDGELVSVEISALTGIGQACLALGKPRLALTATRKAAEMHRALELASIDGISPTLLWWTHSKALLANKQNAAAREALEMAYQLMIKGIASLSDEGLRRNYLNKIPVHREIVTAWIKDAWKRRLSHARRAAHLAGEASLREPFERLVDTGLRLNELRSSEDLHEFLIDEATELSGAERVLLVLETPAGPRIAGSLMPNGEDTQKLLRAIVPELARVRRLRTATLAHEPEGADELEQRSRIVAPLIAQRELVGYLYADLDGAFGRFRESDRDLLGMLASQGAVALANAQWSQGLEQKVVQRTNELQTSNALLEQRAGELAIINSIQQGMAAELDFQAIIDLVGDKLREVFRTGDIGIRWYDAATDTLLAPYDYEHGVRLVVQPSKPKPASPWHRLVATRQPIVTNSPAEAKALGATTIPGTDECLSSVRIPILGGDRVLGSIILESFEREYAYGEAEVRVLSTVAASMGVALENARLFDETQRLFKTEQQRAAELAIINSVQGGLAAQLDFQAIIDLVGEKIREIFASSDMSIALRDARSGLLAMPYYLEHGKRFPVEPFSPRGLTGHVIRTCQPLVINKDFMQRAAELGSALIGDSESDDVGKSYLGVPILKGGEAFGVIALYGTRENEFGESSVNLLTTLAGSMSVALENARLFDETQRLLKETEQRNAELAVINSVQQGLASQLDLQTIINLVGDKMRDVFSADVVAILLLDVARDVATYPYMVDHGERFRPPPKARAMQEGISGLAMRARETLVFHTYDELTTFQLEHGIPNVQLGGAILDNSFIYTPLLSGGQAMGVLVIGKQPEHAFGASDVSLITTVAASLSVALQNALSFEAERQRNAELAVINSIQEGMAAELDFQAIVDLVGDKLREVFHTGDIGIRWYDPATNYAHYLYAYEHGVRQVDLPPTPFRPGGIREKMIATRQPVVIRNPSEGLALGAGPIPGTDASQSLVTVPILGSDRVLGSIVLENYEREDAFGESEVRLLSTVAASMGVALENARLFDETQRLLKETEQRAAELAVINSIQEGMAAELDFQAIVDLVGDKLREVFNTGDFGIVWHDAERNLMLPLYVYEHGVRLNIDPYPPLPTGGWSRLVASRQPLVYNTLGEQETEGLVTVEGTDQSLSLARVPIIASDRVLGSISLENFEREYAFGEAEVRLLSTVAASMGVALENARLFDETQRLLKETEQRNAELAVINQHPGRHVRRARFPGDRRSGRRQAARGFQNGRHRHPLV